MSWSGMWSSFAADMVSLLLLWGAQASVLMAGAALVTSVWRRAPAATRHFIWAVALGGALLLPVASLLPWRASLPIEVPDAVSMQSSLSERQVTTSLAGTGSEESSSEAPVRAPLDWRVIVASVWLLGVLLLLARLELNELMMRVVRARSAVIDDPAWDRARDHAAQRVGARAGVTLLRARTLQIPLATGYHRPAVLLPSGATEWSDELRELVLLHELAHIARRDLHVQTMGQLAKALFWFNPLVWWACARLRAEAERACDDRVLNAGVRASSYAASLLALVRAHRAPRLIAALPMAQKAGFEGRVLAILDAGLDRRSMGRRQIAFAAAACAAAIAVLVALTPARATGTPLVTPVVEMARPPIVASAPVPVPTPPVSQVAQEPRTQRTSITATSGDSARIVRRRSLSAAEFVIESTDGAASLMLIGDAVVLQLTDRWLDSVATEIAPAADDNFGKRLLQNVLRAGLMTALDYGLEYPLSGIGAASYEDGELLLLNRRGKPVFSNSSVEIDDAMMRFDSRDARAFAARVNRAIRNSR